MRVALGQEESVFASAMQVGAGGVCRRYGKPLRCTLGEGLSCRCANVDVDGCGQMCVCACVCVWKGEGGGLSENLI